MALFSKVESKSSREPLVKIISDLRKKLTAEKQKS